MLVAGIWLALAIGTVGAQTAPVGLWRTIDDATGKPKARVRIAEQDGVLSGRIERLFDPDE